MTLGLKYDTVRDALRTSVADVTFTKSDGTERVMACTLITAYLPQRELKNVEQVQQPEVTPTSVRVWDIDKNAWRAFKLDSVKEFRLRPVNGF